MLSILKSPVYLINRLTLNWPEIPKSIAHVLYWLFLLAVIFYCLLRVIYIEITNDFVNENKKNVIETINVSNKTHSDEFYTNYGIIEELKQFKYFYCKEYSKRHVFMKLSQYQYGYELNTWHLFLIELEISRRINNQMSREEIIEDYLSYEKSM